MVNQLSVENDDVDDVVDYTEDQDDDLDDEMATDLTGTSNADSIEASNIAARQIVRDELSRQVAEFLARGGQIREIPSSTQAERTIEPVSDFGDRRLYTIHANHSRVAGSPPGGCVPLSFFPLFTLFPWPRIQRGHSQWI